MKPKSTKRSPIWKTLNNPFIMNYWKNTKKEKADLKEDLRDEQETLRTTFKEERTKLRQEIVELRISSEPRFPHSPPHTNGERQKFGNPMENNDTTLEFQRPRFAPLPDTNQSDHPKNLHTYKMDLSKCLQLFINLFPEKDRPNGE